MFFTVVEITVKNSIYQIHGMVETRSSNSRAKNAVDYPVQGMTLRMFIQWAI